MKIIITDSDTISDGEIGFSAFAKYGTVVRYGYTEPERAAERIRSADVVLCNKTPMTRAVLEEATELRYIGLFATGYNNVDLDYARERGIVVTNVPDYATDGVAQLTFSYLLELYGRLSEYRASVDRGDWKHSATFSYFPYPIAELSGKTMGIVGYGSIGRRVAAIARAFGMNVLIHTRTVTDGAGETFTDLDTLLRASDVVSLHCPLNKASEKVMNAAAFAKMKDSAVFINTARGGLVDEAALRDALVSGKLLGAGLDVLCAEPMAEDCPLYGLKNCIITPHIAWAARETRERLVKTAEENLSAFLSGSPIHALC
ncbi:MAG: D-2-hydroxyacid dehydrogenase [Bacteroides sp.]|nr:D-2-hydroxyacid dehydrogenase [Eubacterium sp.]MCM1419206.1 D-2-hydroxyacid dehydrogenase [Roseburia sp.]MCM1463027.1 D-2-hydroxyacid dehydrogenase [Bacteroides sp.]